MLKNKKGIFFPYGDVNPRHSFPYFTISLITINVAIFLYSLQNFEYIINTFGFVPVSVSAVAVITSMFLHGGLDHLFGNMWYLWIFGDNVEDRLGKIKFLVLYFLSGFAATLAHYITNIGSQIPAIGASGAISGILGSYVVMFPKANVRTRFGLIPAFIVIGLWFVMQLFFAANSLIGGTGSGIAFWAHVGGFVSGFGLSYLLKK